MGSWQYSYKYFSLTTKLLVISSQSTTNDAINFYIDNGIKAKACAFLSKPQQHIPSYDCVFHFNISFAEWQTAAAAACIKAKVSVKWLRSKSPIFPFRITYFLSAEILQNTFSTGIPYQRKTKLIL